MLCNNLKACLRRRAPAILHKIVRNRTQQAAPDLPVPKAIFPETDILKVGQELHGFRVKNVQEVPEFRLIAVYLSHDQTGAEYLHLIRDDKNNVFSVNFRTTPMNSTGLPHILEHTVLCGSKLYPVRDPFFKMLNRSLATFMNAMTGPDYTMYPFSTQNETDFRNLQQIYLDAAFRPELKELDFMQEGWRLENTNADDMKTPLVIKGVVYNEMKGVFSENENILAQKLQNLILPDHTYGVISGGDPMKIPDLTWEDLKKFHRDHYHPSNARFYSYGNFPVIPSLKYINDEYLSQFSYVEPKHTVVPQQKRWDKPKREHIVGRFETMREPFEKQNAITVSLLLSDLTNIYDTFLMQFVTQLLMKGPNSPFYKSMIEPNFSGGFTPSTGYDAQPRDSIFTIGLQGLKSDSFDKVLEIFDKTLDDVVATGFDSKHVESVLHSYELAVKHETSNFGLGLLFGITSTWNHGGNVINSIQINSQIDKLKREMKEDSSYLQNVVKKHFKDNPHRLILSMSPDKDYEKKQQEEENQLIKEKTKNLSDQDRMAIFKKAQELILEQSNKQSADVLPTLQIEDINNDVERIHLQKTAVNKVPLQINHVNSNGIVYFKGLLSSLELTPEQHMILPLLCYIITKLGTNKMNYLDFDSLTKRKTSGLSLRPFIGESLFQLHSYEPGVLISSYCLEKNVDIMWELWSQVFNITELRNVERFQMLLQLYMTDLTQGIADAGHSYAMQAAAGLVSGSSYQKDLMTGLQHISYMKRLVKTTNYKAMLDEIVNIAQIIFSKNRLRCALNISPENQPKIVKTFETFTKDLPTSNSTSKIDQTYVEGKLWTPTKEVQCQNHVLNVPVYYCSKAILTAAFHARDYARLKVLSRLLSAKYLHPEIREKRGAYGSGARLLQDGVFVFYSYRDPKCLETLDVFDNSYKWFMNEVRKITPQDLLEAKLGVFQSVDAPIPPHHKGCDEFLRRLTPDILQRHRAEIMSVKKEGLQEVAEKYLKTEADKLTSKVVLGSKIDHLHHNSRPNESWTVMESD